MEVILAEHAGFCFGVKRAVDTLTEEIRKLISKLPGSNDWKSFGGRTGGCQRHRENSSRDLLLTFSTVS